MEWAGQHVEPDWRNSAYDPNRNADGYTRFDPKQYGAGFERAEKYADAPWVWNQYAKLQPGQPGYDNFNRATGVLQKYYGVDDWTQATDKELFDAWDASTRNVQSDNQKEHELLGGGFLGTALGLVPTIAGFATGNPWVGGLLGAGIGGASGGLKGAALGGLGGAAAGYFSPGYGPFAPPVIGDAAAASALGLSPANLYNPASLGGPLTSTATNLAGGGFTNAAGLGLSASDVFRAPLNNITSYDGGGFFNPDAIGITAEDLYNPISLGGSPTGNNDLLKRVAVNAAQGLLSQPEGASTAGRIAAMGGGGGGGGQRAPYNPMLPPPPPRLPQYFDFGTNPFGGYA